MTVLDTQAIVAALLGEPAAAEVRDIIGARGSMPMVSAMSLAEAMDILVRVNGNRADAARERLAWLITAGLEVVPVDEDIGSLAGAIRSRHWSRDRRPVSIVDCAVLATGMLKQEPIATADAALIGAARAEGHPVVILRDSRGGRAG